MKLYFCELCNYETKIKTHFFRHLNTKKHLDNQGKLGVLKENDKKYKIFPHFPSQTPHFPSQTPHFPSQTPHFSSQTHQEFSVKNGEKVAQKLKEIGNEKVFNCIYCDKSFTREDNLSRHMNYYCLKKDEKKKSDNEKITKLEIENAKANKKLDEYQKEKEKLYTHIEKLLDRVGNTNITHNTTNNLDVSQTQNNVNINNFGDENLDMLTNKFLNNMIKFPFSAIPKMIKKIHFNDSYPQNKNIRMLNKKDNKVQIRKNNQWEYVNKKNTFKKLIDDNNYQLEKYYQDNKDIYPDLYTKRFNIFQEKLTSNDKDLLNEVNDDTELIFWNNM